MSWTPSVGINPPCHWMYTAHVTYEWLWNVFQKGEITLGFLPTNVHTEAKQFLFVAARRVTGNPSLDHAEAQLEHLVLAQKLLTMAGVPTPNGTLPVLHMFCSFFETLDTPRNLWGEERAICSDMAKFFLALKQEGELYPCETLEEYTKRSLQESTTRIRTTFMRGMMPRG